MGLGHVLPPHPKGRRASLSKRCGLERIALGRRTRVAVLDNGFGRFPVAGGTNVLLRTMLKSKIHRATVTHADLHYVGSLTLDENLMEAAGLLAGEQVAIVDIDNGARLETYVIRGERGSGVVGINGAAARLIGEGDLVIVLAYGQMSDPEAEVWRPAVVFVGSDNRIVGIGADPAEDRVTNPAQS